MKLRFSVFVFAVLLAGCTTVEPPPPALPELTFVNMTPIRVDVANVAVVDAYRSPMKPPDVEYIFQPPPDVAAQRMLKHLLVPAGGENVLRAIIQKASVVRRDLPAHHSLQGLLMQAPAVELTAVMKVRFELINQDAPDIVLGHADVVVHREKTLDEGLSPDARANAYFDLTEELMNDLNAGMQSIVKKTFGMKE